MASDQLVEAKAILLALAEVRRLGNGRVLEHLEQIEPDLASWLMEELSIINSELQHSVASSQRIRRLQKQIETLVLVGVTSLRTAKVTLWEQPETDSGPTSSVPPPVG